MKTCPSCASPLSYETGKCFSCAVDSASGPMHRAAGSTLQTTRVQRRFALRNGHPASPRRTPHGEVNRAAPFLPNGTLLAKRYRIENLLGRGGMGEVYRAEDLLLGQPVALKLLPTSLEGDPDARAHLFDEVRLARQISHPNICRVHDLGESTGTLFLTMEQIEGETLADILRREGPLPGPRVVEIARQVCRGLAAAHERGILHRDLKPANLLVDTHGTVRIADFGLAGLAEALDADTLDHGTPAYMAPELFHGGVATVRSDLYALGALLYKLATGRAVFVAKSLAAQARLALEANPEPPSHRVDGLDPALERVILQCLEKEPRRRPLSALEVIAGLPGTIQEESVRCALLSAEVLGRESWPEALGEAAARQLETLHARVVRGLLERHGGRRSAGDATPWVFERPIHAVRFALDYQARLAEISGGDHMCSAMRCAIHLGDVIFADEVPEVARQTLDVVTRLRALGTRHQILMTRHAFDLARQTTAAELEGVRWLAHGSYEVEGLAEALELFEVGRAGEAPLRPPTDSPRARRQIVQETVDGWRPAPGLEIPRRPGWVIREKLSEGGFGEVWRAEHSEGRDLRVFKFCYDARRLRGLQREITLFRLLKEELGERADIARILGWSFEEAPYFIEVEHTDGGDLESWAKRHGGLEKIPLAYRLEIIAQVATALAAAHSIGVLHKDVKPGNVLIDEDADGRPRARLTDFGIGSVTERQRLDLAGITALGMTLDGETSLADSLQEGTRMYMAPEMAAGRRTTVAADVYAIGVMLYQMTVGNLAQPLGPGWERNVKDELLREDIASAADVLPERRLAAAQITQRLGRLETRRTERDEREQQILLDNLARKNSQNWKRRLQWVFAGLLAMTIFATTSHIQARRSAESAEVAQQALALFSEIFKSSDPKISFGQQLTAREILDRGSEKIDNNPNIPPRIRAELTHILGNTYRNLGAFERAEHYFSKTLILFAQVPSIAPKLAQVHLDYSATLNAAGRHREAKEQAHQALNILPETSQEALRSECFALLGHIYYRTGEIDAAHDHFEKAIQTAETAPKENQLRIAKINAQWGILLTNTKNFKQAEVMILKSYRTRLKNLPHAHPDIAESLFYYGYLFWLQGHYSTALTFTDQAHKSWLEAYKPQHPITARTLHTLARIYHSIGKKLNSKSAHERAEKLTLQTISIYQNNKMHNHPYYANAIADLGIIYHHLGLQDLSEAHLRQAAQEHRSLFINANARTAIIEFHLANTLAARNTPSATSEAMCLLENVLTVLQDKWGPEHPDTRAVAKRLKELSALHQQTPNPTTLNKETSSK